MGPSSGKVAVTPSAIVGAEEGAEVEERQALGGCGRQRVRKQSLSRSCSTRWTSRCTSGVLVGIEYCFCRAPLTNFGCPPAPKAILRKFGNISDSPHQNWEFGEGIVW